MFEHAEVIVSRVDLMNHLWDDHQFIDDNTLSVNMNRLRKKLEDIGLFNFIHTKKGLGYLSSLSFLYANKFSDFTSMSGFTRFDDLYLDCRFSNRLDLLYY